MMSARMSIANPDPELLNRITVMQECAALSGMLNSTDPNSPDFPGPVGRAFYHALGCQPITPIEVIAENPEDELQEAIRQAQVENPPQPAPEEEQPPPPTTYRPASMMEKGLMRMALRFCLQRCGKILAPGAEKDLKDQIAAQQQQVVDLKKAFAERPTGSDGPPSTEGTVALSQVVSDTAEGSCKLMTRNEIFEARRCWKLVNGLKRECPEDEEPSEEQLSCLKHLLDSDTNPYLNFSHWGPHGMRLLRKQKLVGMVFTGQGVLTQIELVGPATFEMWEASYKVMVHAMVSLQAIDLGTLLAYHKFHDDFHKRHGARVWALQYQADVRARREHMVRVRRRMEELYSAEYERNSGHPILRDFEPNRPWNSVLSAVLEDSKWWDRELERPALILLANPAAKLGDVLGTDARISATPPSVSPAGLEQQFTSDPSLQAWGGPPHPGDRRRGPPPPPPSGQRPPKKAKLKAHVFDPVEGYGGNRQKIALCPDYQTGNCRGAGPDLRCPKNPLYTHQCKKCLGPHMPSQCEHEKPYAPSWATGSGSFGGGFVAGKGGGGSWGSYGKGFGGKGWGKGKNKGKNWYQN